MIASRARRSSTGRSRVQITTERSGVTARILPHSGRDVFCPNLGGIYRLFTSLSSAHSSVNTPYPRNSTADQSVARGLRAVRRTGQTIPRAARQPGADVSGGSMRVGGRLDVGTAVAGTPGRTARRSLVVAAARHARPSAAIDVVADRRARGRGRSARATASPRDRGAVVLVDQAELPRERRRHLLAVDAEAGRARAVLLRHDHRRRRLGAHRPRPRGLELPVLGPGLAVDACAPRSPAPARSRPATLSTPTVDGLMNGGRMDGLTDGIRLRRATNIAGTTWQEVRMRVQDLRHVVVGVRRRHLPQLGQVRQHHDEHRAPRTTRPTRPRTSRSRTTRAASRPTRCRSTTTRPASRSAAASRPGRTTPTSYLWQYANENNAIPFTQVFIRPQITEADIVAAGVSYAPDTRPRRRRRCARCSTARRRPQPWAVTGINVGTVGPEPARLRQVVRPDRQHHLHRRQVPARSSTASAARRSPSRTSPRSTRTPASGSRRFNPVINAPVWKLKAAPDGSKLFVGGEFTNVNGVANTTGTRGARPGHRRAGARDWVGVRRHGRAAATTCAPWTSRATGSTSAAASPGSPAAPAPTSPARSPSARLARRAAQRRAARLATGCRARDRAAGHRRQHGRRPRLRGRLVPDAQRRRRSTRTTRRSSTRRPAPP